jgi:hypothetical protein
LSAASLASDTGRRAADALPPTLLAECDARAASFANLPPAIATAARALLDLGVLEPEAFSQAKIGFCGLRRAGGGVAAASCVDGVILLDETYALEDQSLPLRGTLAHEMMHHLQHRRRKAKYGDDYCASARYQAEKPALEAEAERFGDEVAELFLLGRAIEIVNACAEPVLVYVEAEEPVAIRGAPVAFLRIPPKSAALSPERALSGRVRFHARSTPASGPPWVWENQTSPHARYVEGKLVRLTEMRLAAPDPVESPFLLRLDCRGGAD